MSSLVGVEVGEDVGLLLGDAVVGVRDGTILGWSDGASDGVVVGM